MAAETLTGGRALAREFSGVLRTWLTAEETAAVIERNRSEPDATICHSHDFCDANEAMALAFERCGVATPAELSEEGDAESFEAQLELWNDSWAIAKAAEFDPEKIGWICRRCKQLRDATEKRCLSCWHGQGVEVLP